VPAWRFSTRRAAWKGAGDLGEQFFSSSVNQTSAVESSSHAPSRASGRLSRGAAHFFIAGGIALNGGENCTLSTHRPRRSVGGPLRLVEIYYQDRDDQNSRRPRFLLRGCNGWPERQGTKSLPDGELWDVRRCEY